MKKMDLKLIVLKRKIAMEGDYSIGLYKSCESMKSPYFLRR